MLNMAFLIIRAVQAWRKESITNIAVQAWWLKQSFLLFEVIKHFISITTLLVVVKATSR